MQKNTRYRRSWDAKGIGNKLYGRRWRKARKAFLAANPLCRMCEAVGKVEAATVVDHAVPHKGDTKLFWDRTNWQPLCRHHHNSEKAKIEIRGYSDRIGEDGWPTDPAHPTNSGIEPVSGKSRPDELRPIGVPVHLVVGPPGSGKTKWCRERMEPDDMLIDFDEIDGELNGISRRPGRLIVPILRERNTRLLEATNMTRGRVFLPMMGAKRAERDWWRRKLGNVTVVMLAVDEATCIERIRSAADRERVAEHLVEIVREWWRTVEFDGVDTSFTSSGGAFNHENREPGHRAPQSGKYLVSGSEDRQTDKDQGIA